MIFFVTGANSGLGLAIAKAAINEGHEVIGTVRSEEARAKLAEALPDVHIVLCDLTDLDKVPSVVEEADKKYGPVDVLVNNAGYGHEGVLEESSLQEMRDQFDINVFAVVAVSKAFIPLFRKRRSGFIINMSSMGGLITMPGITYYCGSKFALQAISNVMRTELASFGVRVTAICPGSFRTDWAGRSMIRADRSIDAYDELFEPIRAARKAKSGKQLGNPDKLAKVVVDLAKHDNPPPQLILGSDALQLVENRLKQMQEEIEAWRSVTISTDGN